MNKIHPGYHRKLEFSRSENVMIGPTAYKQLVASDLGRAFADLILEMSIKKESLLGIRVWIQRDPDRSSDYDRWEMTVLPGDTQEERRAGQNTMYKDVTPGWWWVRYEGFDYKSDWLFVKVDGHAPLLSVYDYEDALNQRYDRAFPLRRVHPQGKGLSDLELFFYNRVEGPG